MSEQLLIIGSVWPEPNSSAAGQRMMQLISTFQKRGWVITFASSAERTSYSAGLLEMGIKQESISVNDSDFNSFVEHLQPDVVIFDRFISEEQFGWRVAETRPDALRILDTEDLHCLRRNRKKAVKEYRDFKKQDLLDDETALREVASIYRSDLSLIISEYEMKLLTNLFGVGEDLLYYLPFLLDPVTPAVIDQWSDFEQRSHFVTVGNFRHPPNRDAVQYLKTDIWPLIHDELPDAELHIYGAYPSQKVRDLHEPGDGFYIKGRVEDSRAVVREGRVVLAPLRFGAGLKGKLVEAMQCGTPNATTPIGAEGLAGDLPWSGAIAQGAEAITREAITLYTDRKAWKRAQQNGIEIINKRFTRKGLADEFIEQVESIKENLSSRRRYNFVGRMLQHHSSNSTKYMSKWIEEKNRR